MTAADKPVRPLRSEADYEAALSAIERYFENEPKAGTLDANRFDLLALVIENYAKKRWPIGRRHSLPHGDRPPSRRLARRSRITKARGEHPAAMNHGFSQEPISGTID
jgi:hypothetical protein